MRPPVKRRNFGSPVRVPCETLIDTFCYADPFELAKYKSINRFLNAVIERYAHCLPKMIIEKVEIFMDRTNYSDKIILRQSANRVLTFRSLRKFIQFMSEHPVPIRKLVIWNSIWISKAVIHLTNVVKVEKIEIRQNADSRYFKHTDEGQVVFVGSVKKTRELNIDVLMEDYMHYMATQSKPVRSNNVNGIFALHLIPPNNFACSKIVIENGTGAEEAALVGTKTHHDLLDWCCNINFAVPSGNGNERLLVCDNYYFDTGIEELVEILFERVELSPFGQMQPFLVLFKNVAEDSAFPTSLVRSLHQGNGCFSAGRLQYKRATNQIRLKDGPIFVLPAAAMDDFDINEPATRYRFMVRYEQFCGTGSR